GSNPERDHDMTMALNTSFTNMDVPAERRTTRVAGRFSLISAAHAATIDRAKRGAIREAHVRRVVEREAAPVSGWIVQVGSFSNPHAALVAAEAARRHARRGDPHVERIRLRRRTWFRAQVTGFTEASAQEACAVIARHQRARCLILRPEHPVVASR
ncbi:MAG TPA: SPOR domain-containing protein, partial [Acetobacteraceae bacterium]|nr:SPOR domain-containing protein [Acetobacteraceae bacterium]